jgi:cell division septal protein FtsQ
VRNELGMWGAAGLSVLCVLMGMALFLWSVRIFKAKRLATVELQGQSLDKPQEIRDQQSVDKTETTLPHRAA